MTQQVINVGTAPNDNQGDPIRTAFIKTNENFTELYALPNPNPPVTLAGVPGDVPGMYAYDASYFYYCFASYVNSSTTIWAKVPQVNSIAVPNLINGNSNVVVSANSNITIGVAGTANVATFTATGLYAHGNVTAANINANYLYGNGAFLTGIAGGGGNYSNANVSAFLPIYTGNISANSISAFGQIRTDLGFFAGGNISAGGNIRGSNFNTAGFVSAYGVQTSVVTVTGNITTAGILTNNYYYANGAPFAGGGGSYGNANVAAYLPSYTGDLNPTNITATGNISAASNVNGQNFNTTGIVNAASVSTGTLLASGNIQGANLVTGGYLFGNAVYLTGLPATYTNANVAAFLPTYGGAFGNGAGNLYVNQITAVGIVTTGGADSNISGADYILANVVSATGNVTANYFIGNGSQLTGITGAGNYSNANVAAYLPTYTGNLTAGNVSATGNVQANYILGNVAFASGIPATYTNANVAAYLPTYTGNLTAGNVSATGNVAAQGVISASGNVVTAGYFVGNFVGNVTGNFVVPGANTQVIFNTNGSADAVAGLTYDTGSNTLGVLGPITTTGNVYASYIFGNGSLLTGITTSNVAVTVSANAQPNITSVGLLTSVSVAGSIVGNVVGSATTVTANAQPNITSTGILTTLSVTGNVLAGNLSAVGNIVASNLSVSGTVVIPAFTTGGGSNSDITGANLIVTTSLSAAGNVTLGNLFVTTSRSPASTETYGTPGEIAWDSNYIYVCTAPNTWSRSLLTGGY